MRSMIHSLGVRASSITIRRIFFRTLNLPRTAEPSRCVWAESDPLLRDYHDREWGVPEHDSRTLWELLMLEGFQAGLAWIVVLRKREALRTAFRGFDPAKVARFTEKDVLRLLTDPAIIRSRAKIEATITRGADISGNARGRGRFCGVSVEFRRRQAHPEVGARGGPG